MCLKKDLDRELKTVTTNYRGQYAANREIYSQYKSIKGKFEKVSSENLNRRLVRNNLLLGGVFEKNKENPEDREASDSDDSSDDEEEEADIRQENKELAETISRQEDQIERLFKEMQDLKTLRGQIKILKFHKKRLKKRVNKHQKFW